MSYTTSPISEYLGSHIYQILGFDTHETKLGIFDNKLVVACRDFTSKNIRLKEIKSIYNDYLVGYNETRENFKTGNRNNTNLEELYLVFKTNPKLRNINIIDRFFDMLVIDGFITNNDRHLGNFGLLFDEENNIYELSPIYDNGNSFYNKHDIEKINKILSEESVYNSVLKFDSIPYEMNKKQINILGAIEKLTFGNDDKNKPLNSTLDNHLKEAILRNQPKIKSKINDILMLVDGLPEKKEDIYIISKEQKEFYKKILRDRLDKIITPAFNKIKF
nr:HipA domain-containing protein [Oceanivirga miroungae]